MTTQTRHIGLSLGADICWPACYEHLMNRLDLSLKLDGDTVDFNVERVFIEPFDLRADCKYDVVIDRLTHWYHTSREWIKKSVIMNDLYVFNNPFALQSMEKHTSYSAMLHLGMPIHETWMVPPKSYGEGNPDLEPTLAKYAKLFDMGLLGERVGYPCFVKPYDGGGWRSVVKCDNEQKLRDAYEASGTDVMHVQSGVFPSDRFVRSIGFGPMVKHVLYDPDAPLHDRYTFKGDVTLTAEEAEHLRKTTLTINTFFGWEFNSCETMRKDGVFVPIDFANPCPDSQVTSLHYHFPWLVKAYVKWSVFCAATQRPMRRTLDWDPFYAIAKTDKPYLDKLDAYGAIADERLDSDRFEEFCDKHLKHLDEVAWEFFGSEPAKAAVREKVQALYPDHEHDSFTELFWDRIQQWRDDTGSGKDA